MSLLFIYNSKDKRLVRNGWHADAPFVVWSKFNPACSPFLTPSNVSLVLERRTDNRVLLNQSVGLASLGMVWQTPIVGWKYTFLHIWPIFPWVKGWKKHGLLGVFLKCYSQKGQINWPYHVDLTLLVLPTSSRFGGIREPSKQAPHFQHCGSHSSMWGIILNNWIMLFLGNYVASSPIC